MGGSTPLPLNFFSRKETRYRLYWRLDGRQDRSGRILRGDNLFPPPGFEPYTVQPVATSSKDFSILCHCTMYSDCYPTWGEIIFFPPIPDCREVLSRSSEVSWDLHNITETVTDIRPFVTLKSEPVTFHLKRQDSPLHPRAITTHSLRLTHFFQFLSTEFRNEAFRTRNYVGRLAVKTKEKWQYIYRKTGNELRCSRHHPCIYKSFIESDIAVT